MLCRVEMPSNEQIFGRFYRSKFFKGQGKNTVILVIALAVVGAYVLITTGISMLIVALYLVLLAAYLVYILYLKPTQQFRQKSGIALQTEIYIFTNTGFTRNIKNEESNEHNTSSSQYSGLFSATETSKDFYLFSGPGQAYLIDKAYFTKGTPEELRATLKEKMGEKFKGKK